MNLFAFSCSMPPSTNNLFATVIIKGKERRIISREYKAWREAEKANVRRQWVGQGSPRFQPHMALTIHLGLNYRGDISNRVKAIEDLIGEAIDDFPNDRWIDKIDVERVPGMEGARCIVMQLAQPEARSIGEIIQPIVADVARRVDRAA
jgi:hypothetical protein